MLLKAYLFLCVVSCIVNLMGPQLSSAVKDSLRETEFQSLWDVLLDTFTNTLVKKCFGKEFISGLLKISPDYSVALS